MFYDLVYCALLVVAFPWLAWQRMRHGKYRAGFAAKFLGRVTRREGRNRCVWFHAVSVGEVMLLGRLIQEWREEHPDWDVVITSTTSTGFELAQRRYADCLVSYAPLDFSWSVAEAFRRWRPDLLVLAELEIWPNLLGAAKERRTPVAIVNGRLSEKSFRGYRRVRPLVGRWLGSIDWIGCQTTEYAERFRALGAAPERVEVTGSLKFDRAESDRDNPRTCELRRLVGLEPATPVWVVGSTQAGEEAVAWEVYRQVRADHPELRLVIVPRHQERFDEVARQLEQLGARVAAIAHVRCGMRGIAAVAKPVRYGFIGGHDRELGAWWGTASVAFVGGSLGSRGGQNMIEPAAYGAAVSFGPETRNFRDVVQLLLAADAAIVVHDAAEMRSFVERCLSEPRWSAGLGQRAQRVVAAQQGATRATLMGLARFAAPEITHQSSKAA
ncbi:MAG: 3-deoxy-D-manno-octulosonic acid transferase [Pirellulaceae bacterium]